MGEGPGRRDMGEGGSLGVQGLREGEFTHVHIIRTSP